MNKRYRYDLFINVRPDGRFFMNGYQAGDPMVRGWAGEYELPADGKVMDQRCRALERIFARHNRDDRPCGRLHRSLSVGDVVLIHLPLGPIVFAVEPTGWRLVGHAAPPNVSDRPWMEVVRTPPPPSRAAACRGFPAEDGRVPIEKLAERHEHDMAKPPEEAADEPLRCLWCEVCERLYLDDGEPHECAAGQERLSPMTRRAFAQAYHRVRLWIRRHGAWPAERDVRACDRVALECLHARQVAVMEWRS